jgi:hypothetical protein
MLLEMMLGGGVLPMLEAKGLIAKRNVGQPVSSTV